jgi:hypothetical protein
MPDLIAIGQGLNAVKALMDIGKTLVGLRDSAKLLEAKVEFSHQLFAVQKALLEAQAEQATLVQTIRERLIPLSQVHQHIGVAGQI